MNKLFISCLAIIKQFWYFKIIRHSDIATKIFWRTQLFHLIKIDTVILLIKCFTLLHMYLLIVCQLFTFVDMMHLLFSRSRKLLISETHIIADLRTFLLFIFLLAHSISLVMVVRLPQCVVHWGCCVAAEAVEV